jgi:hypothetical protein
MKRIIIFMFFVFIALPGCQSSAGSDTDSFMNGNNGKDSGAQADSFEPDDDFLPF